MKYILMLLICLFVFGCNPNKMTQAFLEKITPPEDDKLAREIITNLQKNNLDFIISNFNKKVLGNNPQKSISQIYNYIDHQEPKSIKLIGSHIYSSSNKHRSILTYQIEFPESWYIANIVIDTIGTSKKVFRFQINKTSGSLEQINAFNFHNKGIKNYIILLLSVFVTLFIIFSLIICIKNKIKQKWLWIIFISVGIGQLGINWTTGQILFNPLSFNIQLLGSACFKGGMYAPWIISTSFPLGAIIFLVKRKKLLIQETENDHTEPQRHKEK